MTFHLSNGQAIFLSTTVPLWTDSRRRRWATFLRRLAEEAFSTSAAARFCAPYPVRGQPFRTHTFHPTFSVEDNDGRARRVYGPSGVAHEVAC